jgi:hypothetical protein
LAGQSSHTVAYATTALPFITAYVTVLRTRSGRTSATIQHYPA